MFNNYLIEIRYFVCETHYGAPVIYRYFLTKIDSIVNIASAHKCSWAMVLRKMFLLFYVSKNTFLILP